MTKILGIGDWMKLDSNWDLEEARTLKHRELQVDEVFCGFENNQRVLSGQPYQWVRKRIEVSSEKGEYAK